jgi:membrane protease subunit (stomatin/prohibitin family)
MSFSGRKEILDAKGYFNNTSKDVGEKARAGFSKLFFDVLKENRMAIIDRVKYDGPGDVFVWRWPGDALVWGTQVIVNQAQEALFLKDGKVLDVLGPGVHTLKTANIPILKHLVNIPFGDETPFAAEIYYINKAVNMALKWGTREPIPVQEPQFQLFVPVRAFGQLE